MNQSWYFNVLPPDKYNRQLLDNVHPSNWKNPDPQSIYNLVVIGAGTAGLISAVGAAGLGAKVALIERHLMGGDCLNVGCIPSKCLIRSSRAAAHMQHADRFGLQSCDVTVDDFPAVMQRLRRLRAGISEHDSAKRYMGMSVDVFLGEAAFAGRNKVVVDDKELFFKKAVIATGAGPVHLPIPGLENIEYHTNETIFSLIERPRHLLVIGGGPIGCELAQAFRRLGSKVTIIDRGRFLPREEPEASALLASVFECEGIDVFLNSIVKQVSHEGDRKKVLFEKDGGVMSAIGDEILIGAGRVPNVEGLNLSRADVEYDVRKGVKVNDFMQTTNPDIYAAGDVCMAWKFTHAADAASRIVIQNALFKGRKKLSDLNMPWCTYTDPEIAHVGLYENDAKEQNIPINTFKVEMAQIDRAIVDGEAQGFIKVHVRKGSDRILGATIVSAHAGELIGQISLAMNENIGLSKLARVIYPYPTQAEALKRVAEAYARTRLTPFLSKIFKLWMKCQRRQVFKKVRND